MQLGNIKLKKYCVQNGYVLASIWREEKMSKALKQGRKKSVDDWGLELGFGTFRSKVNKRETRHQSSEGKISLKENLISVLKTRL